MYNKGPSINYVESGGRGQKFQILLSKKTTKRGGGGQKLPILRRHSLWTAPNHKTMYKKIKKDLELEYQNSNQNHLRIMRVAFLIDHCK